MNLNRDDLSACLQLKDIPLIKGVTVSYTQFICLEINTFDPLSFHKFTVRHLIAGGCANDNPVDPRDQS